MATPNVAVQRRASTFPYCGRLIVISSVNDHLAEPLSLRDMLSIDFPAMPDQIELARRAEYKVMSAPTVPDGIHAYIKTEPLEIPFSFKLHAYDKEFCKKGALSLLEIAAKLHAMIAPLGDSSFQITVGNEGAITSNGSTTGVVSRTESNNQARAATAKGSTSAQQSADPDAIGVEVNDQAAIDPPVTLRLELMYTDNDQPGIVCNGYIKDVRAVLIGPFLRGPNNAFNLPQAAEFSFTFIHRPGHGNAYHSKGGKIAIGLQAQTYADYILGHLFNTRQLKTDANYRGFGPNKG